MHNITVDEALGKKVHEALKAKNLETPIVGKSFWNDTAFDTIKASQQYFMEALGLDLRDDSLKGTPERVAKLYTRELFYGLNYANFPKCTTVENKMQVEEMVSRNGVDVRSMCEHHFLPIIGFATVAYLPKSKVIGLSKLDRIVNFFARRPQVQERMTEQIAEALTVVLETENVAVVIAAEHFCMSHRGPLASHSKTVTSRLRGKFFSEASLRSEFLALASREI